MIIRALYILAAAIALYVALVLLFGCARPGRIDYTNHRTGERVRVIQPRNADAPAVVGLREFAASVSGERRQSPADRQARLSLWVGGLLIAVGAGLPLLRFAIPTAPIGPSFPLIGAGLAVIAMPGLIGVLEQNPLLVVIGMVMIVAMVGFLWWDNRRRAT